ncbi:ATP-binding cassette subfamily C protein [Caldanaerobacter subterraneus subsp. tengcongensis MB4]|jgi:ATP-binding cassette subfamily C protein|uniref:ABC-type multidrug/protein/lipid transport system, ATPase component n=1 Tax=Caldanaerobacter subterraneus subsp. tengcongensis (strain DSM 15242 / JCM 11007 / NBRC 100824 / MB4) TaxID=273068 RepID=Q8R7P9_CALS4|nr:ABC transporter ATP-binding protein [Caldanaerobacter subterraneus]AAM25492.1 ABC-type multidrug/protein/lipid transport system, ATPase component [Caldanaerobacter subterraneus subsp. tengcongensis MB4]MCS3914901.1 ATP-binding cassette subfamily C protein [Caldanaerobacter subterraneus subsp. tengcongensis MB4]
METIKKYILKYKLLILINAILIIFVSALKALQAILFKIIVDTSVGNLNYSISTLIWYSVGFLIAVFTAETLSKAASAAFNKKVLIDYKQSIIESFINSRRRKITSSELISLLSNDVRMIETNYLTSLINIMEDVLLFIVSLYLILRINVYLTIVIFIFGWVPVIVPQLFTKINQELKGQYLKKLERFTNRIKEMAQGFEVIKAFNIENKILNMASKDNKDAEMAGYKSDAFQGFQGALSIVSGFAMFFVNILVATYLVLRGYITVGSMIAAVQLMNYIVNPLISASVYATKIKSVEKIADKIQKEIIEVGKEEVSQGDKPFEFRNSIEIKNLTFSYDGKRNALSNINIKLDKGKKYTLVGESGCGKTTLLRVLLNHITDYEGQVLIDGVDIREFDPASYYRKVSIIQQDVFMFGDTLKNNICLYSECSEEELNEALKQSGLIQVVEKLPKGLDTIVGEGEVELSGGERQRIAIARALIKKAEILLIDEATAALDKVTASDIERTLINLDATVLAVTHKLDPEILKRYDEIFVMRDGEIIERGTLDELLEKRGYFYYMYNYGIDEKEEIETVEETV